MLIFYLKLLLGLLPLEFLSWLEQRNKGGGKNAKVFCVLIIKPLRFYDEILFTKFIPPPYL